MKEYKSDFKTPLYFYLLVCACFSLSVFTNSTEPVAFVIYFVVCLIILRLSVFRKAYAFQVFDDQIRVYNQLYLGFPRTFKYADIKRVDLKDHKNRPKLVFYFHRRGPKKYFFVINRESERVSLLETLERKGVATDYVVRGLKNIEKNDW